MLLVLKRFSSKNTTTMSFNESLDIFMTFRINTCKLIQLYWGIRVIHWFKYPKFFYTEYGNIFFIACQSNIIELVACLSVYSRDNTFIFLLEWTDFQKSWTYAIKSINTNLVKILIDDESLSYFISYLKKMHNVFRTFLFYPIDLLLHIFSFLVK